MTHPRTRHLFLVVTLLSVAYSFGQVPAKLPPEAALLGVQMPPIKPPASSDALEEKLAPEIKAVRLFGGSLYGRKKNGIAVLVFQDKDAAEAAMKHRVATAGVRIVGLLSIQDGEIEVFSEYLISYPRDAARRRQNPVPNKESLEKLGLSLVKDNSRSAYLLVKSDKPLSQNTAVELEKHKGIVFTEPNYRVSIPPLPKKKGADASVKEGVDTSGLSIDRIPSDPLWTDPDLWGLRNIHGPAAWEAVTDASKIVAVIDTGIDYRHRDLRDNMWVNVAERDGVAGVDDDGNGQIDDVHGFDFANNDGDPDDDHGHGTHCAGTIAAVGNNGTDLVGVTWRCRLMALKFLRSGGSGSINDAIACVNYASDNGADVMSNSWGGGGFSLNVLRAIEDAQREGAIFVAAAGNNNRDTDANPHYPSSYNSENLVSVLAIDRFDDRAWFSNFGATTVDIGAPGQDILSTVPGGTDVFSGTSMATPHVSGAAALVWSHPDHAGKSWKEIIGLVLGNGRSLPDLAGRCVTGSTLDIEFLGPEIPHAAEAYQFVPPRVVRGPANLGRIRFRLEEPMYVHITAHTSASLRYPSRGKQFRSGFSRSSRPGNVLAESMRYVRFAERGAIEDIQSSLGLKLAAGVHTFYWQVAPTDSRGIVVKTGSGAIVVEAFGRSVGGTLAVTKAGKAIERAEPSVQTLEDFPTVK